MEQISRRSFLKSGALIAATAAGASLIGCGNTPTVSTNASESTGNSTHTWEKTPDPLTPGSTVTTDVVVVGGGMAGCAAAAAAAEAGAQVVLIEKGAHFSFRGIDYAATHSDYQLVAGIDLSGNYGELVKEHQRWNGGRGDERVFQVWFENSTEAANWAAGMLTKEGLTIAPMPRDQQEIPNAQYFHYAVDAFQIVPSDDLLARGANEYEPPFAIGWTESYVKYFDEVAVDVRLQTTAEQLITDSSGVVTGVITTGDDGTFEYDAKGGVILCTGGYGNNDEMMDYFIPEHETEMTGLKTPSSNDGSGILMGAWAGGSIDPVPHCPMYFDEAVIGDVSHASVPVTRQPWLYLNDKGERFENEDLPYGYVCRGMIQQPRHTHWAFWDADWQKDGARMGMVSCKDFRGPLNDPKTVQEFIDKGIILSGNTIEELLAKLDGIDVDVAKASIERYNTMCATGVDTDFSKRSECLNAIDNPPFYAVRNGVQLLVTLGGLRIDSKLNVLDESDEPIEGLYAAGNCSGSFFFNDYPIVLAGLSHGRALTFGRVAGKTAAARAMA
jgi:fumarate reductase flavoprotein subunit